MSNYTKRTSCAICGNKELKPVLNFGAMPLAGDFPTREQLGKEDFYDFGVVFCPNCYLVQTNGTVSAQRLFGDYRYKSGVGLKKHFINTANHLIEKLDLKKQANILDVGCNTSDLLAEFYSLGFDYVQGIDPARNIVESIEGDYVRDRVKIDYFNEFSAPRYFPHQIFDLVTCNNCFAHIDDIKSVVRGVKYCLKPNAHFVIEVSYLKDLVEGLQYPNMYLEHIYYYSLGALNNLFRQYGMTIVDVENIDVHSGSIRVYVKNSIEDIPENVCNFIVSEHKTGLYDEKYFEKFSQDCKNNIKQLQELVYTLKHQGKRIVGYGASGRANSILFLSGLNKFDIGYIVDESPERAGRYTAKSNIPIVSKDVLDKDDKVDYVIIFASNFSRMIMEKLEGRNLKFIIPFPSWRVLSGVGELGDYKSL